jgi:hypothetical protein
MRSKWIRSRLVRRNVSHSGLNHLERFQTEKLKHFRGESVWNILSFFTAIVKRQNMCFKWFWFTSFSFSLNLKHFNKWAKQFHKVIMIWPRIIFREKLKHFYFSVDLELYLMHPQNYLKYLFYRFTVAVPNLETLQTNSPMKCFDFFLFETAPSDSSLNQKCFSLPNRALIWKRK